MSFRQVADVDCEGTPTQIGGRDKKTGKPNPKSIEGYYIGSKTVQTKFGPGQLHVFQTPEGNRGVWGKTDMDRKLATITPGTMTRVTFSGTVPSKKGNDMMKFKVEADDENVIEVQLQTQESGNMDPEVEDPALEDSEYDDSDLNEDEEPSDVVQPERPKAPTRAAGTANPARQRQVQELLKGRRTA